MDDKVDYTEILEFSDDDEDEVAATNKIDDANGKSIEESCTASWLVIHVEVIEQRHFSSSLFSQFIFLEPYRVSVKKIRLYRGCVFASTTIDGTFIKIELFESVLKRSFL